MTGSRCAVDQVFCFFQAEAGQSADNLDDCDLVGAAGLQDDVELGLLFSSFSGNCGACSSSGNRSGCGNAELLFQLFHEVSEFQNGHVFDEADYFFLGDSHFLFLQRIIC